MSNFWAICVLIFSVLMGITYVSWTAFWITFVGSIIAIAVIPLIFEGIGNSVEKSSNERNRKLDKRHLDVEDALVCIYTLQKFELISENLCKRMSREIELSKWSNVPVSKSSVKEKIDDTMFSDTTNALKYLASVEMISNKEAQAIQDEIDEKSDSM
tara:strand:+ start:19094 stop:19564 length:471 start_codon:yes stop_codon:yes gene_type:complete